MIRYVDVRVFNPPPGCGDREILVEDGRIVPRLSGPPRRTVSLGGGLAVVGLVDGHGHLLSYGEALETVDLRGAASWEEAVERLRAQAPPEGWVIGRGWDQNAWPGARLPDRELLDRAFPGRPVALTRVDGHAMVVNGEALRRAGIGPQTPDPEGGRILRDEAGRATGLLLDRAMEAVWAARPAPSRAERRRRLLRAARRLAEAGVTGLHEMAMEAETLEVLEELDREGELPIRLWAYTWGLLPQVPEPRSGDRVRVVGVKLFADGALGSRGAAFLEPYADAPGERGLLLHEPEELRRLAHEAAARGFQVAIHAIGDRGVRVALDALQDLPPTPLPPRIEHAQVVHPSDLPRFATLGAVASVQPVHCVADMGWAGQRLGAERLRHAYAWRSLLRAGATLVAGSDVPVEQPDVRLGLQAACTRQDPQGRPSDGFHPEERLTLEEALHAFSGAAGEVVGAPADRADFTVFAEDLAEVPPGRWPQVPIRCVVVGGRLVAGEMARGQGGGPDRRGAAP